MRDVLGHGLIEDVVRHHVANDAAAFVQLKARLLRDLGVRGGTIEGDALKDIVLINGLKGPCVMHLSLH